MDNPGGYDLFASAVTTALTNSAQTPIESLDGEETVTLIAEVIGFTGGTSIDLLAQTSFDDGVTWYDIALFHFTAAGMKYVNVSRKFGADVQAYAALTEEGANAGLLGTMLRAVVSSVGVFSSTTAALRAHAS